MSIESIPSPTTTLVLIESSSKFQELEKALANGDSILIEDLWNAPKALIASLAGKVTGKRVLILSGFGQEESKLYHDFACFTTTPVIDFPAWETLPSDNLSPSPDIVGKRYKVLHQLVNSSSPYIVQSGLQACLQKLIPPARFEYLRLQVGSIYSFQSLVEKLNKMGYQRASIAGDKGQFAVRGSIIDVFPVSSPDPYRIEFWGDDIESIRIYDPIGQKSVKQIDEVELTLASEMEFLDQETSLVTILDYLGKDTVIIWDDLLALEDKYASLVGMGMTSSKFSLKIEELMTLFSPCQHIFWSQQPIEELSQIKVSQKKKENFYSETAEMQEIGFEIFSLKFKAKRWVPRFSTIPELLIPDLPEGANAVSVDEMIRGLGALEKHGIHLHILYSSEMEEAGFQRRLKEASIALPKGTTFEMGYLSNGIVFDDISLALFPLTEITKRYKIRRQKQRSTYHTPVAETYQFEPGEMVVHYTNGIGRFLGVEKLPNHQGLLDEFLSIEYADNGKLYVPLAQANLVNKYIGSGEESPKMHTLGATKWKKSRESAEKAIVGYAHELLDLYAKREIKGGFRCSEDGADMLAFEEDFPYTETEDQLHAIADIKKDMTSDKAMDRLICGDVGYGKTEVAMRAAFKAVADGKKQVAVLVPTTVLAMQHYESFLERFINFPINIGVLSRFRTPKQTRETIEQIANGSVDIVIGTHRIISSDVQFKDLGLMIIDEEQRFGVQAKEHLKKIKVGVDCLTLSATPIPRTLYMSLIGARDMSVINTPPQDRLPITTIIAETNQQLIKNALIRELTRNGQAFIIHNRVETIFEFAASIQKLVPMARVVVGHGQMSSDELDLVFHAFKNGSADILVSTTIVENGIDIPNANTIIIDRADRFGMAELYQLRGRVGRWIKSAYAYLLVPFKRSLPEIVGKRLKAIATSSGYGGGMKVAMHDLEIRGAGNILGTEQSGQVSSIGFHLYCKLLKRAILVLAGKASPVIVDTKIEFLADARIPEDYVNEWTLRMGIYQMFGDASSTEEIDHIWEDIKDRFGTPPEPAIWLYHLSKIRVVASSRGYTLIKQEKFTITLEQQKGKEKITRRIPLPKVKTPQEMEKAILPLLSLYTERNWKIDF